jgi:hypothetical protein
MKICIHDVTQLTGSHIFRSIRVRDMDNICIYMQLVGATKEDNSLRIIQVNFQIDITLLSTPHLLMFVLLIMVWHCTVAERHHTDDQQAS